MPPIRRLTIGLCVLFLSAVQSGRALAADWTSYLNGNDRVGVTTAALPQDLQLAWTYRSRTRPQMAWSGPRSTPIEGYEMRHRVDFDASMQVVIQGDRAWFGSTVDHKLHCVDARTGAPVWDFYTEGPIRLAPTLAHGNVYFGSDGGSVYCLDAATGTVVWRRRAGPEDDRLLSRGAMISRWPVRTGVLVDGDIAYFGAGVFPHETVFLYAVNAATGDVIWKNDHISQQDAGRNDLSPQGYLLANDQFLYVPSGRSLPVAFSRKTGELKFQRKYSWRTDAGGVVGGTKALLGDGQVYSGGPHHFLAMAEDSGNIGAAWIGGRQMVLSGDNAYLMDGEKIFCVDRREHAQASQEKQKWFLRAREVRSDAEKLKAAREKIKEYAGVGIIWQHASEFDGALIATRDLLIGGGQGGVLALDRSSGEVVWRSDVVGRVTGLAATENVLTVSTDEGWVYGFVPGNVDSVQRWPAATVEAFANDSKSNMYRDAAAEILNRSGQQTGFCLVVGSEEGHLAWELARQSDLKVIGVEPDAEKAARSRDVLERAGVHPTRITIVNAALDQIPFSNYFANLIVSDTHLTTGSMPCAATDVARFLKPCGGVAILGHPDHPNAAQTSEQWMSQLYFRISGESTSDSPWYMVRRGKLPGAGQWTHQYGNVANTSFTNDERIRDGLGVLWYGDPGPSAMINRHEAAGAPLSTNGRMFIQGTDRLMAYDAYNGTFLWDYENPGAIRTGVFNNRETHNLAASDDVLYVAVNDTCTGLDAATGQPRSTFRTPPSSDGIERAWAYVAVDNGQLFGSSTIREELERKLRRRGLTVKTRTDAIFAFDTRTEEMQWSYRGSNILHTTIAIGPERVYFIDSSISPDERQELYRRDKSELKQLTGEAARAAEAQMKALDVRMAVALDRVTGKKIWERPVNVTDTTNVSAGGGSLTLMYADDCLVLCGANANGHYWKQFLAGEFEKRKLVVLDAGNGNELWSKNANYMNRPAVISGEVFAEPWAFNLRTGEPKTRPHPLTGDPSQWRFSRPGHHCGVITATPNMMFFRSGFIGYYDLYADSGTRHFSGQRLGCWINAIPGNGLVMIPEASAGCVCQFSIASTVVLEPKTENKSWGIFSAVGKSTPVRRIGINFGAPGDRKDLAGREWFGYPRPKAVGRLEYVFDLQHQFSSGGGWSSEGAEPHGPSTEVPGWLLSSAARGIRQFTIPLLGKDDAAARYNVRLIFSELTPAQKESLQVEIRGAGEQPSPAATSSAATDPAADIITYEFSRVLVDRDLTVSLTAADDSLVKLAAVEVSREDNSQ